MTAPQAEASGRDYLRLVGLGALIGAPSALVAALFLVVVHELEDLLWSSDPAWYTVIALPVVGSVIVIVARRLLPGDGGHSPLLGIGGGVTPLAYAPGIALAAIGTLSFGAVLGPEAPLIALGSIPGLIAAKLVRADEKQTGILATAGSFSAISALFGGPIVGGLLMIEGGLAMGAALLPVLIPGFVAAAIGYVLFVGLGNWGGLESQPLAVPDLPLYEGTHVLDLLVAVGVGLLAAVAVFAVRVLATRWDKHGPARFGMAGLLLAGGLAVGLLAQLTEWLGGDSQEVLFSGQSGIPELIAEGSTGIVLVVFLAKSLGYAISMGAGFRGGPVFPAIFMGIAIATFGAIWFDVSPTLAVATGAAAGMAATTRLILTPIVFAALLVGKDGTDAMPAAVLAAAAAWMATAALHRREETTTSA